MKPSPTTTGLLQYLDIFLENSRANNTDNYDSYLFVILVYDIWS